MYGESLPNQEWRARAHGSVLENTVFKSAKSLVKIRFTEKQPPTTWNRMASNE